MPRTCTICKHPQRLEIERDIVNGTSLRDIAGRFGTAKTSVARHRGHVKQAIARNTEARNLARTGALLDDVRAGEQRAERLYQQAEEILASALQDKDRRTALQAVRAAVDVMGEARNYMELRGELTNELGRDRTLPDISIQIVLPTAAAGDQTPRISFAHQDSIETGDNCFAEIGLKQFP
jgi:hypothetical protein